MRIEYRPIGVIRSPFDEQEGTPIQPAGALGIGGTVEVFPEYAGGLKDLEGFSHLLLLYHFHRIDGFELEVIPFMDSQSRGLFATRAPKRPNPIGLSVVKLQRIEGSTLHVENIDILDRTPLLDIKPYVPDFDSAQAVRTGWLGQAEDRVKRTKADNRFL